MDGHRYLYISVSPERLASVVDDIEKSMPPGWVRDKTAESLVARSPSTVPGTVSYCFGHLKEDGRPAAFIILDQKGPTTFGISNIIPIGRRQLPQSEYNAVLDEFYQRVFRPCADNAQIEHHLIELDVAIERLMSGEAAERFRQFFAFADKGTRISHPEQRDRWNAFVHSAHATKSMLDRLTFERWLIDTEGWPPVIAEQLGLRYEYGCDLLAYVERRNHIRETL